MLARVRTHHQTLANWLGFFGKRKNFRSKFFNWKKIPEKNAPQFTGAKPGIILIILLKKLYGKDPNLIRIS